MFNGIDTDLLVKTGLKNSTTLLLEFQQSAFISII